MIMGKKSKSKFDTAFASAVAAYGIAIAITLGYAFSALPSRDEIRSTRAEAALENAASARADLIEVASATRTKP